MLSQRSLRQLLAALLLALPAVAAPEVQPVTTEWLDGIWHAHLIARAADFPADFLVKEALYRDALRLSPDSLAAIEGLVSVYQAKGELAMQAMLVVYGRLAAPGAQPWEEEWERLRKLIDAHPIEPPAGDEQFNAKARKVLDAIADRHPLNAELAVRELLLRYPRNPQLLERLGDAAVMAQDWPLLALVYGYYHNLHPDNIAIANNYSLALTRIGKAETAYGMLHSLLAAAPNNALLASKCARLARELGREEEADEALRQWIRGSPRDPVPLVAYARLLAERGALPEARTLLVRAWRLQPRDAAVCRLLAELLVRDGHNQDALFWLAKLKPLLPADEMRQIAASGTFRDLEGIQALAAPESTQ